MERTFNDKYKPITAEELARIPEEMKQEPRWICWGSDKVPVSPVKGSWEENTLYHYGINVTNSSDWCTYEQARNAIGEPARVGFTGDYEYFHIVGIGFVVGDCWFCVDLDGGKNHQGKEDVPEHAITDALQTMQTYAEKSLSGCGYHVFGKCYFSTTEAERNKPHRGQDGNPVPESYEVEFFTRRKFIAITGRIVDGSSSSAKECTAAATDFYNRYILNDWKKDEQKRAEERARIAANIPVNIGDAEQMFLLNYPEILAASDSSNFKRGGRGVKLGSGEYSWIGAVKAMQEIGVPESAILDWCRRGSNFKNDRDVINVLNKRSKSGTTSTVASVIADAKAHGWKPDPDKLTGEYKANHEAAEQRKKERAKKHRERVTDALAAVGMSDTEYSESMTVTYNFDGSVYQIIDTETGEIIFDGVKVNPANPAAAAPANTATDPAAPWDPIIKADALPVFPLEHFPEWIKDYIINFTENTGISKDFCAACVLGAVSSVVCGHLDIHFNGTHYEPAQLYTVFVGRSGSMKSTAVKQFIGPARAWLMEENKFVKSFNQGIDTDTTNLQDDLFKEQKKKSGANDSRIADIKAQIENKKERRKNQYPVPFSDVTPESLVRAIIDTNGTATIATAEGNIINVLTGRSYTQRGAAPNLDIFLNGHDGEPFHSFRVTTGEVELPRVDISMLLAIQPSLLETLCRSSDANGRGLVQRFLIFAPEESAEYIDHTRPNTTEPEHARRWNEHIRAIAARFMQPDAKPIIMELHLMADRIIRECWNYEGELMKERGPADEEGITGWISKLHGKALRLAAILALLNDPNAPFITDADAETAVALLKEYFIPHYIGSFETADNLTKEQRIIVNWIVRRNQRAGSLEQFAENEAWKDLRQRSTFAGKDGQKTFRAALDELQELNFIRQIVAEKIGSGRGRPAKIWQVNPELFTMKSPH